MRSVEDTLPHTEKVMSSDGVHKYTVTITEDYSAHCDCTGFYHRRYCRHVREVLEKLIERVRIRDNYVNERDSSIPADV